MILKRTISKFKRKIKKFNLRNSNKKKIFLLMKINQSKVKISKSKMKINQFKMKLIKLTPIKFKMINF